MNLKPLHFIDEPIAVEWDEPPAQTKTPGCPDRFVWRGDTYTITALLSAWQDFQRRGRMGRNMRPEHLTVAAQRGSWGVGRFFFRVHTGAGRIFDLYYDRAPKDSDDRQGSWVLYREMGTPDDEPD